ncbi:helix-turn-helix domain-containing protein [Streptomyces phaeolivaceus]|uniref:helix-turn-helix domain-containing protein n=1 Tax=Streptomyces phaeolivaceus TaxID=2653200 RepID=UPI001D046B25|nr:helix-turn-helix transcriptional regulator [Streptomyces phaeolivaceus]
MELNKDPEVWRRLGRALREARERRGWSQEELAAEAGVSKGAVQGAEAGRVPKTRMPQTLAPIARALGWPAGSVERVIAGGEPPGGWHDVRAEIADEEVAAIMTNAMVRSIDGATGVEIRQATESALAELRRRGFLADLTGAHQNESNRNA